MGKGSGLLVAAFLAACSVQAGLFFTFESYPNGAINGQDGWIGQATYPDVSTWNFMDNGAGDLKELRTASGSHARRSVEDEAVDIMVVKAQVYCYGSASQAQGKLRLAVGGYLAADAILEVTLDARDIVQRAYQGGDNIVSSGFTANTPYEITANIDFTAQDIDITIIDMNTSTVAGSATVSFYNTKTLAEAQTDMQIFLYSAFTSAFWDNVYVGEELLDAVFHETFEPGVPMASTLGLLDGQNGWSDPSSNAMVQADESWELDQAVSLGVSEISQSIGGAHTNVQTVFAWKPAPGDLDTGDIPSDATVVFWVNSSGALVAYNDASPVISGAYVDSDQWSRILVQSDYVAKEWSLWLDGTLVVDGFGFYNDTLSQLTEISFLSEAMDLAYIDDIIVNTNLWIPQSGDTDGDGLDDDWEVLYFNSPHTLSSGAGDYDSDGYSDGEEDAAYTDPTDANSIFEMTDGEAVSTTEFVVRWPSASGRVYTVESATNLLAGGWSNVESDIPATPPENSYTVLVSSVDAFVRVKVTKE